MTVRLLGTCSIRWWFLRFTCILVLLYLAFILGRDKEKVMYTKRYLEAVGMLRDFKNSAQDPDFTQVRNYSVFWLLALCSVLFYCDGCVFPQKLRNSQRIPCPLVWSAQLSYFKAQWNETAGCSGVDVGCRCWM